MEETKHIHIQSNDACFFHTVCETYVGSRRTKCCYVHVAEGIPKNLVVINAEQQHVLYNIILKRLFEASTGETTFSATNTMVLMDSKHIGCRETSIVCKNTLKRIRKEPPLPCVEANGKEYIIYSISVLRCAYIFYVERMYECQVKGCTKKSSSKSEMCKVLALKMSTSDITTSPTKGASLDEMIDIAYKFMKVDAYAKLGIIKQLNEGFRACGKCCHKVNRYVSSTCKSSKYEEKGETLL